MRSAVEIGMLYAALVLAAVAFYFGFLSPDAPTSRTRLQWLFLACLVVIGFLGVKLGRGAPWSSEIARYVVPYPAISWSSYVPRLPSRHSTIWVLATPDPPDRVYAFYHDERNRPGWELITERPMDLRRDRFRLIIIATADREETRILYELSEAHR